MAAVARMAAADLKKAGANDSGDIVPENDQPALL
jgi:hypothetical protein